MNIGIDLREVQDFPTGIGRYFKGLVYGLKKVGKDHTYTLIINRRIPKFIRDEISNLPDNFKKVYVKSKTKTFSQYLLFPLNIKHLSLDILITSPYGYSPFIKTPVALVILDQIYRHYPEYAGIKAKLYMNLIEKQAAKRSKIILTDSKDAKKDIIRFLGVKESKAHAIHLAPDPIFSRRTENGKQKADILEKYKIRNPFVMFVGNRRPHKNLLTLLKAFSLIKDELNIQLVVVGDDDSKNISGSSLKLIIENCQLSVHGDVILTGHIPDNEVVDLYQHALCLVHPALIEGFGLTPLEAMASGCPVIASNTSSLPEVVGDAGLLINPKDEQEISDAIKLIAENKDLKEGLKEKGLKRAGEFSWEKMAHETLNFLSILG